jgi:hypothetical protein
MRIHLGLLVLVASSGCLSTSTMGLARTLNRGKVQGWVAAEGGGIITANTTASTGGVPTGVTGTGYPMVEGGIRVGASDHVELGARLGFNGIGLEGKFAFLRSPTMDSGFNLSLAPQVGFFGIGVGGLFVGNVSVQLPLLMGLDFAGHELVFGPKLHNQIYVVDVSATGTAGSAVVDLLSAGASVGIALQLGPIRMMPEVSFIVPFFASGAVTGVSGVTSGAGVGGFIFQAGLGVMFGSKDAYEHVEPPAPPLPVMPLPPSDSPPPLPPPSGS